MKEGKEFLNMLDDGINKIDSFFNKQEKHFEMKFDILMEEVSKHYLLFIVLLFYKYLI